MPFEIREGFPFLFLNESMENIVAWNFWLNLFMIIIGVVLVLYLRKIVQSLEFRSNIRRVQRESDSRSKRRRKKQIKKKEPEKKQTRKKRSSKKKEKKQNNEKVFYVDKDDDKPKKKKKKKEENPFKNFRG